MIVLCNWTTSLYQRWKNCKRNIETSDHHAVSSDHKLLVAEATVKLAKRKNTHNVHTAQIPQADRPTSSFLIMYVLKMFRPHRILSLHGLIYFCILRYVVSHQFRYKENRIHFRDGVGPSVSETKPARTRVIPRSQEYRAHTPETNTPRQKQVHANTAGRNE